VLADASTRRYPRALNDFFAQDRAFSSRSLAETAGHLGSTVRILESFMSITIEG
jgi:hypothetical protein